MTGGVQKSQGDSESTGKLDMIWGSGNVSPSKPGGGGVNETIRPRTGSEERLDGESKTEGRRLPPRAGMRVIRSQTGAHVQASQLLQRHPATRAAPPEHIDCGPPQGTWAKRQDEDHRPGSPQPPTAVPQHSSFPAHSPEWCPLPQPLSLQTQSRQLPFLMTSNKV